MHITSLNAPTIFLFELYKSEVLKISRIESLVGEKIYLSKLDKKELEEYIDWFCTPEQSEECTERVLTLREQKEWIAITLYEYELIFKIVRLDNNELIGHCSFTNIDYINKIATVGIQIKFEKDRNNGYGTEALKLMLNYGFKYINLQLVKLTVNFYNKRAINCYKKVGFKELTRKKDDDMYIDMSISASSQVKK